MTSKISRLFAFNPTPSCVVGEYPEERRDGAWGFTHVQSRGAPMTRITLLDIVFKEQTLYC